MMFKTWLQKRIASLPFFNILRNRLEAASQKTSVANGQPQDGKHVVLVLFLSGFMGFCIGMFGQPTWQSAVEASQVVARIIPYPPNNPFYVYQTAAWTILHQIYALFLLLGVSERTLCVVTSGLLGMISFQALALCVFALSQDKVLAITAPVFIYFTRAVEFTVVYPVWLLGHVHTYGILGLSFMLLTIALMGVGQYKWGGLLLGLAPAIHPSLGAFLWLIVLIGLIWDFQNLWGMFRKSATYIFAGCGLTLLSLGIHFLVTYDAPSIAVAVTAQYLTAFIKLWDAHRQPVNFRSAGVYLVVASLGISFVWGRFFKQDFPSYARVLLRILFIAAVLGLGLALLSHLPSEIVPQHFLMLMPSRYVNINILSIMAILIGLLDCYKNNLGIQCLFSLLVVLPVASRLANFAFQIIPSSAVFYWINLILRSIWSGQAHQEIIWVGICAGSLALLVFKRWNVNRQSVLHLVRGITLFALGVPLVIVGVETYSNWQHKDQHSYPEWATNNLRDRTNDLFFATVSERPGMLLTCANMYLVQLRTRRPVLLEGGALDGLPYAPAAGPEISQILQEVYGIDFFNPPLEAMYTAAIPVKYTQTIWEARMPEEWSKIKTHFGVTDILTYADWHLKLPKIAANEKFILYQIPLR